MPGHVFRAQRINKTAFLGLAVLPRPRSGHRNGPKIVPVHVFRAQRIHKICIFGNCSDSVASACLGASGRARNHARARVSGRSNARKLHFWELQCCRCLRLAWGIGTYQKSCRVRVLGGPNAQKLHFLGIAVMLLPPHDSGHRDKPKIMPVQVFLNEIVPKTYRFGHCSAAVTTAGHRNGPTIMPVNVFPKEMVHKMHRSEHCSPATACT